MNKPLRLLHLTTHALKIHSIKLHLTKPDWVWMQNCWQWAALTIHSPIRPKFDWSLGISSDKTIIGVIDASIIRIMEIAGGGACVHKPVTKFKWRAVKAAPVIENNISAKLSRWWPRTKRIMSHFGFRETCRRLQKYTRLQTRPRLMLKRLQRRQDDVANKFPSFIEARHANTRRQRS